MSDRNILYRIRSAIAGGKVAVASEVENTGDSTPNYASGIDNQQDVNTAFDNELAVLQDGLTTLVNSSFNSGRAFVRFNASFTIDDTNLATYNDRNVLYTAAIDKVTDVHLPSDQDIADAGISYPVIMEFTHLGGTAVIPGNNLVRLIRAGGNPSLIVDSVAAIAREQVVIVEKTGVGADWVTFSSNLDPSATLLPSGVFHLQTDLIISDIDSIESEITSGAIQAGNAYLVEVGGDRFGTAVGDRSVIVALVNSPSLATDSEDWLVIQNGSGSLTNSEIMFFNQLERDGTRFDLSRNVFVNEANVITFNSLASGTPLTNFYFTTAMDTSARSVTFSDQAIQFTDLIGGTLSLAVGFNASSFSGFLPELTSLVFNFSGTTFTFPINVIDAENGVGTVDIEIPNADYSAILNSNCDITLNYQYRGDTFIGSFTIASLINTLDGSLRSAVTDIANNAALMAEQRITTELNSLGSEIDEDSATLRAIQPRLSPYKNVTNRSPDINALFLDSTGSDAFPSAISAFSQVSASNPRFTGGNTALFVAARSDATHALLNITQSSELALDTSEATVDLGESLSDGGNVYFVYRVTGLTSGDTYEVDRITTEQVVAWPADIDNLQEDIDRIDAELENALLHLPDALTQVLENEVTVSEEDNATNVATIYNRELGDTNGQTVFPETNGNSPSNGQYSSAPIVAATGDRARRKLIYLNQGAVLGGSTVLSGVDSDGENPVDLISFADGQYTASVRVPVIPASTVTDTIYPAPSNRVSGSGIWITVPAITFVNGVPSPIADEVFFTRNTPSTSTTLNIQYRGHSNGNIFGASSTTLAGVGGANSAVTSFSISAGSESATVEVRWNPSDRSIRVSVTESVSSGLPTINDIQVILSYDEQRTVPGTPETLRQVPLEYQSTAGQVFAMKPSATGTIVLVGTRAEIDTGITYFSLFSNDLGGQLILNTENGQFYDYEDFDPIVSTIVDLENHSTLPQYGLFTTQYTHDTTVTLDTQLRAFNSQGDVVDLGQELVLVATDNTRWRLTVGTDGTLVTTQVT